MQQSHCRDVNTKPRAPLFIFVVAACGGVAFLFGPVPIAIGLGAVIFSVFIWLTLAVPDKMFLFAFALSLIVSVEVAWAWGPLPRIGPTIIVLLSVSIGTCLLFMRRADLDRSYAVHVHIPMMRVWIVTATVSFLSSFFSINRLASAYAVGKQLLIVYGLSALFAYLLPKPGFFKALRDVTFSVTALICILAFLEEFIRYNPFLSMYPIEEPILRGALLRVRSTFFHPIALGTYLALVYPFLVVDACRCRSVMKTGLICLVLTASFLTVSRGPWIAILIESIILIAILTKKNFRVVAVSTLLILSAMTFRELGGLSGVESAVTPLVNPAHANNRFMAESSSEFYRVAVVEACIDRLAGGRWIYGYGPGTFYLADVRSKYAGQDHVLTAGDCQYALTLLETGIVGLATLLLSMAYGMFVCVRTIRRTENQMRALAVACLAAVVGMCVNCITASMFILFPLNLIFWMVVIIGLSSERMDAIYERAPSDI